MNIEVFFMQDDKEINRKVRFNFTCIECGGRDLTYDPCGEWFCSSCGLPACREVRSVIRLRPSKLKRNLQKTRITHLRSNECA